jgi:sugar phosphate isomerase/epimerase
MDKAQFKRGISIYSFQEKYFRGELSLEQCIATASGMGVRGIEMLADQMLPGYPSLTYNLSDEFVDNWKAWLNRYRVEPVAFDVYGETKLFKNRSVTHEELLSEMLALLKTAKALGFSILRLTFHLPLSIVEALIPYAEEAGIKLAIEVHAPHLITGEWVTNNLELAARKNTKHLGIMPDLGIFCRHLPHLVVDEALREGATPQIVDYLTEVYESPEKPADLMDFNRMGANDVDKWLALRIGFGVWTYHDPKHLVDVLPYIFHIHGKFYEMTDAGIEADVAYDSVLPILINGGYTGYIMSEYEGQRLIGGVDKGYDEVEQVRRHQAMLSRYQAAGVH